MRALNRRPRLIRVCDRVPGISAIPHEDNLRYFDVKIDGPSQSPYECQCFCRSLATPMTDIISGNLQTGTVSS